MLRHINLVMANGEAVAVGRDPLKGSTVLETVSSTEGTSATNCSALLNGGNPSARFGTESSDPKAAERNATVSLRRR